MNEKFEINADDFVKNLIDNYGIPKEWIRLIEVDESGNPVENYLK